MVLKDIEIQGTIDSVKKLLESDRSLSEAARSLMSLLLLIVELLIKKLGVNSRNSSLPPSLDPNRKKETKKRGKLKPGGQAGHAGATLSQTKSPDEIISLAIDRRTLPRGETFISAKPEKRQKFDIILKIWVTEYQAEVLIDSKGRRYVAPFPDEVKAPVQYGPRLKGLALYMTCYQMLPFERLQEFFCGHLGLPISQGTLCNIRSQAAAALETFHKAVKIALLRASVLYCDETGINVAGKNRWLHCVSSSEWTLLVPHEKRGKDAPDAIGVLPSYKGIAMHDNWAPYFAYENCDHALCNAHQVRELTRLEEEGVKWGKAMKEFLLALNEEVNEAGGVLTDRKQINRLTEYQEILKKGDKESPKQTSPPSGKRGRQKQSVARNLLDRLILREKETLLFMSNPDVPFTNNQGERDQRMTKVKMKVSGTYKNLESAANDALIRSFISTCKKKGYDVSHALNDLSRGVLPEFVKEILN